MDVGMVSSATEAPLIQRLPAQELSRDGDGVVRQENIVPNTNMNVRMDGGATEAPSVQRLPA